MTVALVVSFILGFHAPQPAAGQVLPPAPQLNPDKTTWIQPDELPTFRIRARVVEVQGKAPAGETFGFNFGGAVYPLTADGQPVTATDSNWSDWIVVNDRDAMTRALHHTTWLYRLHPLTLNVYVQSPVHQEPTSVPIRVEAELEFDETRRPIKLAGELIEKAYPTNVPGLKLGILIWRGDGIPPLTEYAWPESGGTPQAATMAQYNQRYWKQLEGVEIPRDQRPSRFPLVDGFAVYDDDRQAWLDGIAHMARAGFTALVVPPTPTRRQMLLDAGISRTAHGAYHPPGYTFEFGAGPNAPAVKPGEIEAWAKQQVQRHLDAGYAPEEIARMAMSDEPNWSFPSSLQFLQDSPEGMARFREYLKAQGLEPADVGADAWHEVMPVGRSKVNGDLPERRLYYWSMRFFAHDSARHFANSAKALEEALYPGVPITTNWNNFGGRFVVPGSPHVPADQSSADAATGGHDWLEFGRLRGGTTLFTEDWFWDPCAFLWSYYGARLRAGAELGGVSHGGYVIGCMSSQERRHASRMPAGIMQKVLGLIGSGGKVIDYYRFGPEYNFPGNCYSEIPEVLPRIAETNAMIGAAEDLLWPGQRPPAEIGILFPRSAFAWDLRDPSAQGAVGESQVPTGGTTDYVAEVVGLYTALQHANIHADFVDEDDLASPERLQRFRVLYVTEPNIPVEGQEGLAQWLRAGGTLVTVTGAGARDRYDEPAAVLADATGIAEQPRERLLIPTFGAGVPEAGRGEGTRGAFTAAGARGTLTPGPQTKVEAKFDDGTPAVLQRSVGRGRVVHFAFLPGFSYVNVPLSGLNSGTLDQLPTGFSESLRAWITYPVELAEVRPPVTVSQPLVEAPVLVSDAGTALILLNWSGQDLERVEVTVRSAGAVKSVEGVKAGTLEFEGAGDAVTFSLPLGAADIVMLRR